MTKASEEASQKVDYQLSHHRTKPRKFEAYVINSEYIDDAYRPGEKSPGQWLDAPNPKSDTVENWIEWYFQMALQEEIHETLEWFRVNDQPYLNPHGLEEKIAINAAVRKLHVELMEIRNKA